MLRFVLTLLLCLPNTHLLAAETDPTRVHREDHVLVRFAGIEPAQADSIAQVVGAARAAAVARYGFDLPETITVDVRADPRGRVRLFNDGADRLVLSVRRPADLRRPDASGVFHVYGLCHEVGHLAMYRTLTEHDWLTTAATEGWAHAIGSQLVDDVFEAHGSDLWWDAYDFGADGTARLRHQLAQPQPSDVARAAGLWLELAQLIGDQDLSQLLSAWAAAEIIPTDPGAAARAALLAVRPGEDLADWWNRAEPLMVFVRPASGFEARTLPKSALMNRPETLAHDDGQAAGKRSMAGSGHAVRFQTPGPAWFITSIEVHGSRYGHPRAPDEDFQVWLCDERGAVVRSFSFPYGKFRRGAPAWVRLPIEPTETPESFLLVVGFNPTATKGVYVSRDAEGTGHSQLMLPGKSGRVLDDGDWMIRARVDQPKTADALRAAP